MSLISSQLPISERSSRQNQLSGAQAGSYIKEQSFSFKESLDAGIVLQTKEGDKVSLSSGSFSQMDAYLYDSKGFADTDTSATAYSMSQREVTLVSGVSFAFSVDGSLSEEEFADIETMLKDLDGIISEMKAGDMDEALGQAMEMGGYDTVSTFSADISLQQSYAMRSYTAATLAQTTPGENETGAAEQVASSVPPEKDGNGLGKQYGHYDLFEEFFQKVVDQLAKHDDKIVGVAKSPINNLFKHHLEEVRNEEGDDSILFDRLGQIMEEVDALIDEWMAEVDGEEEMVESSDDAVETEAVSWNQKSTV